MGVFFFSFRYDSCGMRIFTAFFFVASQQFGVEGSSESLILVVIRNATLLWTHDDMYRDVLRSGSGIQ